MCGARVGCQDVQNGNIGHWCKLTDGSVGSGRKTWNDSRSPPPFFSSFLPDGCVTQPYQFRSGKNPHQTLITHALFLLSSSSSSSTICRTMGIVYNVLLVRIQLNQVTAVGSWDEIMAPHFALIKYKGIRLITFSNVTVRLYNKYELTV